MDYDFIYADIEPDGQISDVFTEVPSGGGKINYRVRRHIEICRREHLKSLMRISRRLSKDRAGSCRIVRDMELGRLCSVHWMVVECAQAHRGKAEEIDAPAEACPNGEGAVR
ncbi:MAG TPA: hypothetical protein PLS03_12080 [Terrimicrobiaceae bacterium]|nr:hypothetical protein [Terrimicrobiaceae bacterium]